MKKIFIYFSVFVIAFLAYFDIKDRFKELDEVAANTQSQVELKQMMNKGGRFNQFQSPAQNRMNETGNEVNSENKEFHHDFGNKDQQNQLNNVDRRRNTITNPVN